MQTVVGTSLKTTLVFPPLSLPGADILKIRALETDPPCMHTVVLLYFRLLLNTRQEGSQLVLSLNTRQEVSAYRLLVEKNIYI